VRAYIDAQAWWSLVLADAVEGGREDRRQEEAGQTGGKRSGVI